MTGRIPIRGPLGLTELLDGAFRLYRARFGRLALTAGVVLVPLGIVSMLLSGVAMGSYLQFFDILLSEPGSSSFGSSLLGPVVLLLLGIAGALCTMLVFTSLLVQVFAALHGEELSLIAGLRRGAGYFWSFFAMSVLAGLAIGGVVLLTGLAVGVVIFGVLAVFVGITGSFSGNDMILALVMLASLGLVLVFYVLILLPAGLLLARWIAAPVVIVGEQAGPGEALGRSWRLTAGRMWRCFGYLLLLVILNFVVLGLPMMVLQWGAVILAAFQMMPWIGGGLTGIAYFFNVLWYPFLVSALVLLYYDLRIRAESYDLEFRISQMEDRARPATLPGA